MFFEDDPSPHCEDSLFDKLPEKYLKYVCKTRKLISVEHAYVTPKEGKEGIYDYLLDKILIYFFTCMYLVYLSVGIFNYTIGVFH